MKNGEGILAWPSPFYFAPRTYRLMTIPCGSFLVGIVSTFLLVAVSITSTALAYRLVTQSSLPSGLVSRMSGSSETGIFVRTLRLGTSNTATACSFRTLT